MPLHDWSRPESTGAYADTQHTISGSGPHLTFFRFGCRSVCRMETKWRQSTKLHKPDKSSHHEHSTFLFENTCRTMSVFNITPWLSWRRKNKLPNEPIGTLCETTGNHRALSLCFSLQRAVPVPVPLQIPRFQVWGSNPSHGNFFAFFPSPNFLQWSIQWRIFVWRTFSIDWYELSLESHHKKLPWLGFEPQTWKRGTATARCRGKEGKRSMTAYCSTQCSNGWSLGSFLLRLQDNHVQRCTTHTSGWTWYFAKVEQVWQ